jgi:hypothetical protein
MKNSIKALLICLFLSQVVLAQKTNGLPGNDTEQRTITGEYHAVDVSSGIKVNVVPVNSQTVLVTASNSDYRNKIKTIVVNDTLKIFFYYKDDPNWKGLVNSKETFKVTISATDLRSVKISEGASINIPDQMSVNQLFLRLESGGEMTGSIKCEILTSIIQDGSYLKLYGEAKEAIFKVKGAGRFDGKKLIISDCKAEAGSASELYLSVSTKLDATAYNYAKIFYMGNPILVKKEIKNGLVRRY